MINAQKIANKIKRRYKIQNVDAAIVVGSGLIDAVPDLENPIIVPYESIHMPKSNVKGHTGKFIFGDLNGKKIVLVSRIHFYENGDMEKVRLPFEIVAQLGVKQIVLLTSCGGINKTFRIGDVMIVKDHINFTGFNPLVGVHPINFVAMNKAYDIDMINKALKIADDNDIVIRQGRHIQFCGPSYETMAEIEVVRDMGADTVSMSSVFDCIICNYLGIKVCTITSIVNVFDENPEKLLTHEEVLENAKKACQKIKTILTNLF